MKRDNINCCSPNQPFRFWYFSYDACLSRFLLIPTRHLQTFGSQSRRTQRLPFRPSGWLGRRTFKVFIDKILGKSRSSSFNAKPWFMNYVKIDSEKLDRRQFMGHLVGWRRLFPDTSWHQRMWNRKLRSSHVAARSFDTEKSKNSEPTILVVKSMWQQNSDSHRCSSYSVSIQI